MSEGASEAGAISRCNCSGCFRLERLPGGPCTHARALPRASANNVPCSGILETDKATRARNLDRDPYGGPRSFKPAIRSQPERPSSGAITS
jgi:hypothetical protein